MQTCIGAKAFEKQSLGLDTEFHTPQQLGGCTPFVALFGVVKKPGLVVKLFLGQVPEKGASLLNIRSALAHQVPYQTSVWQVRLFCYFERVIINGLENVAVVFIDHFFIVRRWLYNRK